MVYLYVPLLQITTKRLMMHLDGTASGSDAFSGISDKAFETCNRLPGISFEAR